MSKGIKRKSPTGSPSGLPPVLCSPRSSSVITLPKNGVFNTDLVCNLRAITVHRDAVIMFLPKGDCTDMSGAIKIATSIHPKCKRVVTISGDAVDMVYQIKAGKWKSFVVAADYGNRANAQAQRPGPWDATTATGARWPGSLQRMVRRRVKPISHWMGHAETPRLRTPRLAKSVDWCDTTR